MLQTTKTLPSTGFTHCIDLVEVAASEAASCRILPDAEDALPR